MNISTYSIQQILYFIQSGDTTTFFSGRISLWEEAWVMIKEKPILGYGVGLFESIRGVGLYPHNIFLDIMVTSGAIGFVPIFILIILSLIEVLKSKSHKKVLGMLLLIMWFPKLLFSYSYIFDIGFWAFVAYKFIVDKTNESDTL